jgi:hypothetical protein
MPGYTKPTDTAHKIQVKSNLIYALWTYKSAHAGQEAGLEAKTSFVGNGAKIKVTCKNESGKKLDKVEGEVFNNKFEGKVLIPDNVKPHDMVFFEAELPKHGLKGESNLIPVKPAIKVTSLRWDRREVKRGDMVTLTCQFQSGVEDGDEATVVIYERNPNSCDMQVVSIPAVIKGKKVELQWEFDYQNNTLQIPTDDEMKPYKKSYCNPEFFFVVLVDGVRIGEKRESGLMVFKDLIELELQTESGITLPDHAVVLHYADGSTKKMKTDENGCLRIQSGPPGPVTVEIPDNPE